MKSDRESPNDLLFIFPVIGDQPFLPLTTFAQDQDISLAESQHSPAVSTCFMPVLLLL